MCEKVKLISKAEFLIWVHEEKLEWLMLNVAIRAGV